MSKSLAKITGTQEIIPVSSKKFFFGCLAVAAGILLLDLFWPIPRLWIAAEVFLTVLSLFLFGSIKYRIDKNVLAYGAGIVVLATFWATWRKGSGTGTWVEPLRHYLLTFHGLNELVHADTMLFILGLTLFVAAIAQTRLLESISFAVLRKNKGWIVPTFGILTAIVSIASGILDGVSMIGLMIRVLVLILFLAKVHDETVLYAVLVSTVVTTVCGMWLAYGEPPNLIMKANLHPYLNNAFFLRYCLPVAVGSYLIVFFNIRKRLKGAFVDLKAMDILDLHTADVRYLQASRHGEVWLAAEFVDRHQALLGSSYSEIERRLHRGEPLGAAFIRENVPEETRKKLLGLFVAENLAEALNSHYQYQVSGHASEQEASERKIRNQLGETRRQRHKSQGIGALAFIPFVGFLVWHAVDPRLPLFAASFAGFAVAFLAIIAVPNMRRLALKEAWHEYSEYLFLLPLFFSITLLQKTGFFETLSQGIHAGTAKLGVSLMSYLQFTGAAFLSAILDNNVVADFAGRALHGLEIDVLHLFAMAQIAGYAAGGCWTHIGSAQSVVAYAFIRREVDPNFTPFRWIKAMTPVILEIFILMTVVIYGESLLLKWFPEAR